MTFQNAQLLPSQFHLFIYLFFCLCIYLTYGIEAQVMREAAVMKAFALRSGKECRILGLFLQLLD